MGQEEKANSGRTSHGGHPDIRATAGNDVQTEGESKIRTFLGPQIRDYAIIGDCRSAALISRAGSLDWLCWPRFDSPSIFGALLDPARGGRWSISPVAPFEVSRKYVPDTNVLEGRFETADGTAALRDLMPVCSEAQKRDPQRPEFEIIRQAVCEAGTVELGMEFAPRPGYGSGPTALKDARKLGMRFNVGHGVCYLRCDVPLKIEQRRATAAFMLRAGESATFSLSYNEHAPAVLPLLGADAERRIDVSIAWWKQWSARMRYDGPFRDAIMRSALTLKLMAYPPSGAIIAAPTTSLPEQVGGPLNWDYRYCWLRDASLTARALFGLGYHEEADAFLGWLTNATSLTQPELRVMYDVFGEKVPRERELSDWTGYEHSGPVRVGNGAREQFQLDVYGEVVDAISQWASEERQLGTDVQKMLSEVGEYVCEHWMLPDEGIWEPRGGRFHHTHSKVLCWAALDRLVHLSESGFLRTGKSAHWKMICEKIAADVRINGWDARLNSYVAIYGQPIADASLLLLAWYGFEKAESDRMRGTYAFIHRELGAGGGLLYRNRRETGDQEAAFGICSFWGAEYLALGGSDVETAGKTIASLIGFANDLGLFAEEIDPTSGAAIGNFPQAFTHVGLINAALTLAHREQGRHPMKHQKPAPNTKKGAA